MYKDSQNLGLSEDLFSLRQASAFCFSISQEKLTTAE